MRTNHVRFAVEFEVFRDDSACIAKKDNFITKYSLCKKCPNTELFWSVFSCIRTEYGDLQSKSAYSVRIQENMDQKKLRIWILFTQ